jgi:hypothetical protein
MTKTDLLAGPVRRHDVSDLNLAVGHDYPVYEQLNQEPSLLKIGFFQAVADPTAEILDGPG